MAATFTPGPNLVTVEIDNPQRDDLGGVLIWMSTVNGFTPGPTNLVYNGPDLVVVLTDLAANTPLYFRYALYSEIDPTDYDTSAQFTATPTAPAVKAEDILAGNIRGSNVFAGMFATKAATLAAAVLAASATLPLQDATDFPVAGSGWVYDYTLPALQRIDNFSWTGKSGNTLTGVTGVSLAHSAGRLVVPAVNTVVISHEGNEVMGFGDRGDGVVEPVFRLGLGSSSDTTILDLGVQNSTWRALNAGRYGDGETALFTRSATNLNTATAMVRMTTAGGPALDIIGLSGQGSAITTRPAAGYGAFFKLNAGSEPRYPHVRMEPSSTTPAAAGSVDGAIYMAPSGMLRVHDGSSWLDVLRQGDTILAPNGTEAAPSYTFAIDPDSGFRRRGADIIALTTGGVDQLWIGGNVNARNQIYGAVEFAGGSAAAPAFSFSNDPDTGMYSNGANVLAFTTAGTWAGNVNASGDWNFARNIAVGEADPTASATIKGKAVISGNTSRFGVDSELVIDGSVTLTAARSYYGMRNIARTKVGATPKAGFDITLYGTYSLATVGETSGTPGLADTVYGAYNYALCWTANNSTVDQMHGTYSYAHNSADSASGVNHLRGMFSWARQATAENGTGIYGVDTLVQVDAGTFTHGYLFKGAFSGSGIGTKWGLYLIGATNNRVDGYMEVDGLSSSVKIGYSSSSSVTQATSKSTAVTCNGPKGEIKMASGALAAGATVRFTVNNNVVSPGDVVVVQRKTGGTGGVYNCWCDFSGAGSFVINVTNQSGASRDETPTLTFTVFRGS